MTSTTTRGAQPRKAADVLKAKPMPKLNSGPPIRASELVLRRAAEACKALERAIDRREQQFAALARAHATVWKCARQVKRYEHLVR